MKVKYQIKFIELVLFGLRAILRYMEEPGQYGLYNIYKEMCQKFIQELHEGDIS